MKRPNERLTLRYTAWDGPLPAPGDFLRTRSGRRYEILDVHGRRLDCRVAHPDDRAREGAREFDWYWNARRR